MLFGFNGFITKGILGLQDFNIYGFKGVFLSQVFTFAPWRGFGSRAAHPFHDRLYDSTLLSAKTAIHHRNGHLVKISQPRGMPGVIRRCHALCADDFPVLRHNSGRGVYDGLGRQFYADPETLYLCFQRRLRHDQRYPHRPRRFRAFWVC